METPISRFHAALCHISPDCFSTAESIRLESAGDDELYFAVKNLSDWTKLKRVLDSVTEFPVGIAPASDGEYSAMRVRIKDLDKLTDLLLSES